MVRTWSSFPVLGDSLIRLPQLVEMLGTSATVIVFGQMTKAYAQCRGWRIWLLPRQNVVG
jgi:hypothetical protein